MSTVLPLLPDDPEELGGYTLIGRLGGGGMGTVFLARSAGGRLAAVKTVRADLRDRPGYRERLALEAEAATVLGAEHTAAFLGADPDAARPWLATAYLIGPSLTEAVAAGGPLPEQAVRRLGSGLAEALAALHRAGLVHRDLKPSNVLITAQGPRLIDFGLAQAPGSPRLTAPGGITGTPAYMSPEQARGERPGTPGDVFALGGVLVFASSGHGPYDGDGGGGDGGGGRADTLRLLRDGAAPDLSGVPHGPTEDEPHGLGGTLAACLAPAPSDRPSPDRLRASWGPFDADAFADALPQALLADVSRRFGEIAAVSTAPLRGPAPRRAPSRRTVLAGAAAAAVTGAGLTALRLTGSLPGVRDGTRSTGSGSGGSTATPGAARAASRSPGTPPAPLWSIAVPFTAGPAMATEKVLVHHDDVLRGLSTTDGRVLWEAQTSTVALTRTGNRLAGLVFDTDGNGSAGYVDPQTGRLGADSPGPAVLGELAQTTDVLTADDTCLYLKAFYRSDGQADQPWAVAYDLAAGQVRWRRRLEGAIRGRDESLIMSAVVSGGRLICTDAGRICALDVRDGRLLWSCRLRTDPQAAPPPEGVSGGIYPPTASDRHAFDFDGTITAVDLLTGTVAWRLEPENNGLLHEPVCLNGTVYVADEALHAFDDATGKKTWTHATDSYVRHIAVPDPFRGELYTAVSDGGQAVVAVDTAARRTAWALSAGAVGMSDGADRLVQHGNRLYAQTLDRVAAVPLD